MTHPVFELILNVERDLRGIHAKLTELRAQLAALTLPEDKPGHPCPRCGVRRPTEEMLHDHLVLVHALDRSDCEAVAPSSGSERAA